MRRVTLALSLVTLVACETEAPSTVVDALEPDVSSIGDGAPPEDAVLDAALPDRDLPTDAMRDSALPDAGVTDADDDGISDASDNCLGVANPTQRDADDDGLGDACDVGDTDGDGIEDRDDPCPAIAGEVADQDNDGIGDPCDVCPRDADPTQADADGDGVGDACEIAGDDDRDGTPDASDNCPRVANLDQADQDGDGVGDACDICPRATDPDQLNVDGDDFGDACDPCPAVPSTVEEHLDGDGDGVPTCAGDCDDADPQRAPERAERCDEIDNDCDGTIDEGFDGLGDACATGLGACRQIGATVCGAAGIAICDAQPLPASDEACDGLDNDCDGVADEALDGCCVPDAREACGLDLGTCIRGQRTCGADGNWGACDGIGPADEICDGEDNDCDGMPDEGLEPRACGVGLCARMLVCGAQCDPLQGAAGEICDRRDNDCDGAIDEDLGAVDCDACPPGVERAEEVCDGQDNDCDGAVDEATSVSTRQIDIGQRPAFRVWASDGDGAALFVWTRSDPDDQYRVDLYIEATDADGRLPAVIEPVELGRPQMPDMAFAQPRDGQWPIVVREIEGPDQISVLAAHAEPGMMLANGVRLVAPAPAINPSSPAIAWSGAQLAVLWGAVPDGLSRPHHARLSADLRVDVAPVQLPGQHLSSARLVSTGDELVSFGYRSVAGDVRARRLSFDGRWLADESVLFDSPLNDIPGGVRWTGDRFGMVVHSRRQDARTATLLLFDSQLRQMRPPIELMAPEGALIAHTSLIWTGTRFGVAMVHLQGGMYHLAFQWFSRDGEALSALIEVPGATTPWGGALAWTGHAAMLMWIDRIAQRGLGMATIDPGCDAPGR